MQGLAAVYDPGWQPPGPVVTVHAFEVWARVWFRALGDGLKEGRREDITSERGEEGKRELPHEHTEGERRGSFSDRKGWGWGIDDEPSTQPQRNRGLVGWSQGLSAEEPEGGDRGSLRRERGWSKPQYLLSEHRLHECGEWVTRPGRFVTVTSLYQSLPSLPALKRPQIVLNVAN